MSSRVIAALLVLLAACASGPSPKERERADIHYKLGVEALHKGQTQEALKNFDVALQADPNLADAHAGRALVLEFGFGKLDDAEKEYRRALELKPIYPEVHNNLGQLLAKRGRLQDAVAQFDEALAVMTYGEPYVARCNRGEALYRLGRRDEGLAEIHACLKVAPQYCLGHRMLGRIHLDEGRAKAAVESFDRYAQHCPSAPDAFYQLGLAQLKAGDAAKASEAFEKCEQMAQGDLQDECRRSREMLQ